MSRLDLEDAAWADPGEVHDDAKRYLDEECSEDIRNGIKEVAIRPI